MATNNYVVRECNIANTDIKGDLVSTSSVWMALAIAYESTRSGGKNPKAFMTSKSYKEDTSMSMLNSAINIFTESDSKTIVTAWTNIQRTVSSNNEQLTCPVVSDVLKVLNQTTNHDDECKFTPYDWGNINTLA
jgi:hypothetical protein